MRVMLNGKVFPARLMVKTATPGLEHYRVLVVDESIALLPEEASATGCVLADATTEEREALVQAGFTGLVGSAS
jgi:hypothetical protein